jgi:hypothetical protein
MTPRANSHAPASLLLAFAAVLIVLAGCSEAPKAIKFDSSAWLAAGRGDVLTFTTRGRMADDLVKRGLSIGMTRAEVLSLLGEPDQPPSATEIVYYLGKTDSFLSGLSFLVLYFDADRLVRVRVAED